MSVAQLRLHRRLRRWGGFILLCGLLGFSLQAAFGDSGVKPIRYTSAPSVKFDHAKHPQPCASCHGAATTSTSSADDLGPSMSDCAACHAVLKPNLAQCSACHEGSSDSKKPVTTKAEWEAVRPAPFVAPRTSPEIKFSHRQHSDASIPCATCHAEGTPGLPKMQVCVDCHAHTTAPQTCSTCHTTDVTPQIKAADYPVKMGARPTSKPDSHQIDWVKRHGVVALTNGEDCMSCHQEPQCASCHTAQVGAVYAVHPPNFVTIHAVDARMEESNCTTCHSTQNFCTACHVRAEVTTRPDARPPSRVAFHPPGFVDPRTPDNHGVMARRNIVDCASCHTENDCVTCHTGINPHPADFRVDCKRWLDANPRPCAKCHEDPAGLREQCL